MLLSKIRQFIRRIVREELNTRLEEGLDVGTGTTKIRNNRVHVTENQPKVQLEGTEAGGENISLRENAGSVEKYNETNAALDDAWSLSPKLEPGSIQNVTGLDSTDVLRDTTGSVVFTSAGTASASLTATGSTSTTTGTTAGGNYTQVQLTLTGTFTTATAKALLNGSTVASLTAAGTTTLSATTVVSSPTWTLDLNMSAGSNATAGLSPSINQKETIKGA